MTLLNKAMDFYLKCSNCFCPYNMFLSYTDHHCSLQSFVSPKPSLIVVQMFFKGLPSSWWTRTFHVLPRIIVGGHKLQSHFILVAERRAWTLHLLLLCQLFSAARGCVWNFICSMEEWIVHLEKDRGSCHNDASKTTGYLLSKYEYCEKTNGPLMMKFANILWERFPLQDLLFLFLTW